MIAANKLSKQLGPLFLSALISAALAYAQSAAKPDKSPLAYVNGLVGTAPLDDQKLIGNAPPPGEQLYSGFTSPGARLPHSSTELAPINANLDLSYPAGVRASYFYSNRTIFGFSSGAGNSPTVMPVVGDWTVPPERSGSVYDKKQETSSPGYYSVYLEDYHTRVELTATTWTGIFRFTFPKTDKANILLDLGSSGGDVEVVNDHTVRGKSPNGRSFFIAEFSKPFQSSGVFKQVPSRNRDPLIGFSDVEPSGRAITGPFAGTYLHYVTTAGEQVLMKVATGVSFDAAEARLHNEDPNWNFDAVKHAAENAWATKLDQVEVKGGTEKQRMLFYSCLIVTPSPAHT